MRVLAAAIVNKFVASADPVLWDSGIVWGSGIDWADDSIYTKLSGQLYHTITPQSKTWPYGVFSFVSDVYEYQFVEDFENVLVQFDLYSNNSSPMEVEKLFTNLKDYFDNCSLTVAGYTHFKMVRQNSRIMWEDTVKVWHRTVEYRVLLEKL